jgi:flagellar biosynthesis chaperone FliJ
VTAKGCHGQTVYSAKKLEGAVREAISPIFDMLTPDMNMAWEKRRKKRDYGSSQTQVRNAEKNLEKLEKQRLALEHEVVNSLTGESNFETSFLTNLIATNREAIAKANEELERIRQHTVSGEESIQALNDQYQGISDWKTVFDHADLDSQKMFLARIINRIEVDRDYHVTIYFNMPITMKCA